jgi:hypothetical protein
MARSINWPGVVAALIFGQVLSFVWYGRLFASQMHGLVTASARTPLGMVEGAGLALVMIIGLNLILNRMAAVGFVRGAAGGAMLWLFLPLIGETMNVLYMGESTSLFLINTGYTLIFLVVAGALVEGFHLGRRPLAR